MDLNQVSEGLLLRKNPYGALEVNAEMFPYLETCYNQKTIFLRELSSI
jgi:hypothetical protein